MPSELRQILFRAPEIAQAVIEYHRRMRTPFPAGTIVRCVAEGDSADGPPRIRLVIALDDPGSSDAGGAHREVMIDGPTLAAALILHCRDRRIPLPATAQKSLQRFGNQIGLIVRSGLRGTG